MMRRRSDRGVALVEFALIAPIVVLLFSGAVDVGYAYFRSSATVDLVRSASVVAFDAADSAVHDGRVLEAVVNGARNRGIADLERIVVFNASGGPTVPSACLTDWAMDEQGVLGVCAVYGPDQFALVDDGQARSAFDWDCPYTPDRKWCARERSADAGWTVGIYVVARENALIGLIPPLRSFEVSHTAVVTEYKRNV